MVRTAARTFLQNRSKAKTQGSRSECASQLAARHRPVNGRGTRPASSSITSSLCRLFPRRLKPSPYLRPVDDIPPRRDVVGAPVLILEVIRMLPHVEAKDGDLSIHQRAVLVRAAEHLELPARDRQPRPAAAESGCPRGGHLLLELGEVAEGFLDRVCQRAGGLAAPTFAGGSHDRPKQRVVVMTARVIADRRADILGDGVDPAQELLERL